MSILVDEELVIGRLAEGAGRLADDDEISRSHARIKRSPTGHWTIEDLGSTNGTLVNGLRIEEPVTLSQGDAIQLGATTLVVHDLPEVQPAEPAALQRTVIGHPSLAPAAAPEETASPSDPPMPTAISLRALPRLRGT